MFLKKTVKSEGQVSTWYGTWQAAWEATAGRLHEGSFVDWYKRKTGGEG